MNVEQVPSDQERLLPRGKSLVPGKGAINTNESSVIAAKRADLFNTPENLASFFDAQNKNVLFVTPLLDGYVVSEVIPTAPYTEEGVMVCAGNPEELRSNVNTQSIYDLPKKVQEEYWRTVLANLVVFGEDSDRARFRILATENTTPRTSRKHRTSRTLDIPHVQINRFDRKNADQGGNIVESLLLEQKILQDERRVYNFAENVCKDLDLSPKARQIEPYGYVLELPIDEITAIPKVSDFQRVMELHHEAYTREAKQLVRQLRDVNQKRIIPQPSYRTYIFFDEGKLKIIISPEFISHAGVTEAAGLETVRTSEATPQFSEEKLLKFKQKKAARVKEILDSDGNVARSLSDVNQDTKTYIGSLLNYDEDGKVIPAFQILRDVEHIYSPSGRELDRLRLDMNKDDLSHLDVGLSTKLRMLGVITSSDAEVYLKGHRIRSKTPDFLDIIWLTGKDLGFTDDYVSQKDLFDRAEALGLEKCPAKAGPLLAINDKRKNVRYVVPTKKSSMTVQGSEIFGVHGLERRHLDISQTEKWQTEYIEFAFCLPPKQ